VLEPERSGGRPHPVEVRVPSSTSGPYTWLVDLNALAELKLPDADGVMHRLGDAWRDRPIVLVFLRHFG
jgi:hypothetical protein